LSVREGRMIYVANHAKHLEVSFYSHAVYTYNKCTTIITALKHEQNSSLDWRKVFIKRLLISHENI